MLAIEPMTKDEVLAMQGIWKDRPASDFEEARPEGHPLHADR